MADRSRKPTLRDPRASSLRSKIAFGILIAILLGLLFPSRPLPYNAIVFLTMAISCGLLFDVPEELSLSKSIRLALLYFAPIELFVLIGTAIYCVFYWILNPASNPIPVSFYSSKMTIALAAYPLFIISCFARPTIIELVAQAYGIAIKVKEAGIRVGITTRIVVVIFMLIFGVSMSGAGKLLFEALST